MGGFLMEKSFGQIRLFPEEIEKLLQATDDDNEDHAIGSDVESDKKDAFQDTNCQILASGFSIHLKD